MRSWRQPAVLLFCVVVSGCSRCGKPAGPASVESATALTRRLPKSSEAAVLVADVGALGEKLQLIEGLKIASFAAQLQGSKDAHEYVTALLGQLGVDLRSKEELRKAGIDPDRGLAVALLPGGRAFSVLGVKDASRLEKLLQNLATQRLGAGVSSTRKESGVAVTSFSAAAGAPPKLGYVIKDDLAYVAADESIAELPRIVALDAEQSLAREPALDAALKRLGGPRDVAVYFPGSSPLLSQNGLPANGPALLSMALDATGLDARLDFPWNRSPEALALLEKKPGPDLLGALPADAFFIARFAGLPSLLAPALSRLLGPGLEQAFQQAGVDLKTELLDNLKPGVVAALSLSPDVKLGAGVPALDVRQTNPFRFVQLSALAEVNDAAKAASTLDKLPAVASKLGAKMVPTERGGRKVFVTSYAQGEGVHLAAQGNRIVAASPLSRLDTLLAAPTTAAGGLDPALRKSFDDRAEAVVIDLRRLSDSIRALPSEAFGLGGFAIKATSLRWLEATDDLRAITASVEAREGAIQGQLGLRFQKR